MRIDIQENFTYHAPTPEKAETYALIRKRAGELAVLVQDVCPDSRERSLALTKIEEAMMWANASVARNG